MIRTGSSRISIRSASATSGKSSGVSASVDYVRMNGRDIFFHSRLNLALGWKRSGGPRQTRPGSFGLLMPAWRRENEMYRLTPCALITTHTGTAIRCAEHPGKNGTLQLRSRFATHSPPRGITAGQGARRHSDVEHSPSRRISPTAGPTRHIRGHGRVKSETHGVNLSGASRHDVTPFPIRTRTDRKESTIWPRRSTTSFPRRANMW